jgi:hypothetical protein
MQEKGLELVKNIPRNCCVERTLRRTIRI